MIKLSKRLEAIASFIRSDARVADIGCDHALLDVYLVQKYPNIKTIAIDNKQGAINQALANIEKYRLSDSISVRLGEGLVPLNVDEVDTIVIAGMGYLTIMSILEGNRKKLRNIKDLIIQSNTDYYDVRKSICKKGFYIFDELLVKEGTIISLIIHFAKGSKRYSMSDYLLGPILRHKNNDLYQEWLLDNIKKKEILYLQIPHKYFFRKDRIKKELHILKKEIK